jgi:hypothetical protein
MEPRKEEKKTEQSQPVEKLRRFRIVKLEERIAPGGGHGNGTNFTCKCYTDRKCAC